MTQIYQMSEPGFSGLTGFSELLPANPDKDKLGITPDFSFINQQSSIDPPIFIKRTYELGGQAIINPKKESTINTHQS